MGSREAGHRIVQLMRSSGILRAGQAGVAGIFNRRHEEPNEPLRHQVLRNPIPRSLGLICSKPKPESQPNHLQESWQELKHLRVLEPSLTQTIDATSDFLSAALDRFSGAQHNYRQVLTDLTHLTIEVESRVQNCHIKNERGFNFNETVDRRILQLREALGGYQDEVAEAERTLDSGINALNALAALTPSASTYSINISNLVSGVQNTVRDETLKTQGLEQGYYKAIRNGILASADQE